MGYVNPDRPLYRAISCSAVGGLHVGSAHEPGLAPSPVHARSSGTESTRQTAFHRQLKRGCIHQGAQSRKPHPCIGRIRRLPGR